MDARGWLDAALGAAWAPLFEDVVSGDALDFPGYAEQLQRAREATGCTESVLVARGAKVVAIAFEFGFLGGSMGAAAGERICRAFELGAAEGVPVVALTASGGARMQEGMLALAQMPATLGARELLARAHVPFIAYLRNPTTGGVYASFASSADVLWAEPGATIGFAGPRVAATVTGEHLPAGSHTAESAFGAGLVDGLIAPEDLPGALAETLEALTSKAPPPTARHRAAAATDPAELDGAAAVRAARAPDRPTGIDYLGPTIPLRRGGDDDTILAGIGRIDGMPAVLIATDRRNGTGRPTPASYRRAQRAIETAARLALPIVAFVDTPGAEPGAAAEADGIAHEISRTFDALLRAPVPTIACVVGEGGSGGALALAACDRVLIQRSAIFSVIAPEGAASILRRDDVEQVARELRLTAHDLLRFGLADAVIGEDDPARARAAAHEAISAALRDLGGAPSERRAQRWRVLQERR